MQTEFEVIREVARRLESEGKVRGVKVSPLEIAYESIGGTQYWVVFRFDRAGHVVDSYTDI